MKQQMHRHPHLRSRSKTPHIVAKAERYIHCCLLTPIPVCTLVALLAKGGVYESEEAEVGMIFSVVNGSDAELTLSSAIEQQELTVAFVCCCTAMVISLTVGCGLVVPCPVLKPGLWMLVSLAVVYMLVCALVSGAAGCLYTVRKEYNDGLGPSVLWLVAAGWLTVVIAGYAVVRLVLGWIIGEARTIDTDLGQAMLEVSSAKDFLANNSNGSSHGPASEAPTNHDTALEFNSEDGSSPQHPVLDTTRTDGLTARLLASMQKEACFPSPERKVASVEISEDAQHEAVHNHSEYPLAE
ncbi:hypothetical protein DIPPA_64426 [Diplonema papillatum]|nr:hypothetical protein DIPPA_64426 [Diplonema papillatum]